MKKVISSIATAVAAVAFIASPVFAATAPHTFGHIQFNDNEGAASAAFDVHGSSTSSAATGSLSYSAGNGNAFVVSVDCLKVTGADARFSGQITHATNHSFEGKWVNAKVHDGGPNGNGDKILGNLVSHNPHCSGPLPFGPFNVTRGDLTVEGGTIVL